MEPGPGRILTLSFNVSVHGGRMVRARLLRVKDWLGAPLLAA